MQTTCPFCKTELDKDIASGTLVSCPSCGKEFSAQPAKESSVDTVCSTVNETEDLESKAKRAVVSARKTIQKSMALEKVQGFTLSGLLSETFKKHTDEEIEDRIIVGTRTTTPDIVDVDTSWPKPWLFWRVIIGAGILFLLLDQIYEKTESPICIPSLMFVGSFAIPLASVIFFLELNVKRNMSLFHILRLFFHGGVLGLLMACTVYEFLGKAGIEMGELTWYNALLFGIIEEVAKLLAVFKIANIQKFGSKINGLLIGSAVGAGFAALESAGYAFAMFRSANTIQELELQILLRGVLSPFTHVVWATITVGALWRTKGSQSFSFSLLISPKFVSLFLCAVALHALWDMPWPSIGVNIIAYIVIGISGWVVVLSLLQEGLNEVRREKEALHGN